MPSRPTPINAPNEPREPAKTREERWAEVMDAALHESVGWHIAELERRVNEYGSQRAAYGEAIAGSIVGEALSRVKHSPGMRPLRPLGRHLRESTSGPRASVAARVNGHRLLGPVLRWSSRAAAQNRFFSRAAVAALGAVLVATAVVAAPVAPWTLACIGGASALLVSRTVTGGRYGHRLRQSGFNINLVRGSANALGRAVEDRTTPDVDRFRDEMQREAGRVRAVQARIHRSLRHSIFGSAAVLAPALFAEAFVFVGGAAPAIFVGLGAVMGASAGATLTSMRGLYKGNRVPRGHDPYVDVRAEHFINEVARHRMVAKAIDDRDIGNLEFDRTLVVPSELQDDMVAAANHVRTAHQSAETATPGPATSTDNTATTRRSATDDHGPEQAR